jgi:hypothetical protein
VRYSKGPGTLLKAGAGNKKRQRNEKKTKCKQCKATEREEQRKIETS